MHPKTPKDQLLDILIEIPGVSEHLDCLLYQSYNVEDRTSLLQNTKAKCWILHDQLQEWMAFSGASTIAFVEAIIAACETNEFSAPSSEDFAKAHLRMVYWTTCLLLYQTMCCLKADNALDTVKSIDPRRFCRKIAILIRFFQNDHVGACFVNFVAFSAVVLVRYLAREDVEGQRSVERRLFLRTFEGTRSRRFLRLFGEMALEGGGSETNLP